MDVDELSDVLTLQQGAYLVGLVEREPVDEALFGAECANTAAIAGTASARGIAELTGQLYEGAVIEDNRHQVFYVLKESVHMTGTWKDADRLYRIGYYGCTNG